MEFGLTEYQCRVYLALLDLGTAAASQTPSISRVPRTRIYATMQQLHEKGLVEIVPETPLRYRAVPFSRYLRKVSEDYRQRATSIESEMEVLSKEFSIRIGSEPEERGRFEAMYGRRNARERLLKMYESAQKEIIGVGTRRSPGRILKALGIVLEEKSKAGVSIKYAFPIGSADVSDIKSLMRFADVHKIDFEMPIYMHAVDRKEFFMSHPIPDDESFHVGDDICIWTDDVAITKAMSEMAERIWREGQEPTVAH
jgi:sugar-specific transcriptional regulator TrmB